MYLLTLDKLYSPALVCCFFDTLSNPFFFKIKLLPVKQAEVTARANPIQKSLIASSFVSRVHNVVVDTFSVVFSGSSVDVITVDVVTTDVGADVGTEDILSYSEIENGSNINTSIAIVENSLNSFIRGMMRA